MLGTAVSRPQQLGRCPHGATTAAQQQQRRPQQRPARSARAAAGPKLDIAAPAQEQQQQQQQQHASSAAAPAGADLLQRIGRAAAGAAVAAVLALGTLPPPPAGAVLANPRAPVPRSADVALRRSIPAFNADVAEVQDRLEAIAFKLRIPQRKPWKGMADDAAAAAAIAGDPSRMLRGVLPGEDSAVAEQLVADVQTTLDRLARAIEVKDISRTSIRVSNALEQVAELELLQAPGLPYQLPRQLAGYPALTGRAIVELTVEKASGERAFVDPDSSAGPQKRAQLRLVVDGYSAPITAANFVLNAQAGRYNNLPLAVNGTSVFASRTGASSSSDDSSALDAEPGPDAAAADAAGAGAARGGNGSAPPGALPLEILPAGDFEPLYRSPLDVRSGELPVLPLSIYGAVAMARLPDGGASGFVSATDFFITKFERQQAGLAGLSFDEGEFGVFGYITKGLDAVAKLESGDRIVRAEVVAGLDKLSK